MIQIAGHRLRIALRHLIEIATGAVVMGGVLSVVIYFRHWDPRLGIGLALGLPVAAHAIGALIGAIMSGEWLDPPQVRWDRQGLTYGKGDDSHLAWSDYEGYRFTWEYPARVKIHRRNGHAVKLDLFAFGKADRSLLLAELEARTMALPNKRLKLTARPD